MYFVYMLECKDGSLYTGIAKDVELRLQKHIAGTGARYTRARGARRIVHTEKYRTKGRALKREAELKRLSRFEKLELIGSSCR